jgi:cell shape-determining protein MreC
MIIINLLPQELRPIKRTPLPHLLSVLVLIAALAGMAFMFLTVTRNISNANSELAKANEELEGLRDTVEEYNALSEKKQQLENKISVIQEILSDRIIWSEQLHRLSELTPDNFWYKRIRETSKTVRVERVELDPKTGEEVKDKDGKPKIVKENVKRPVFEISGYVINNEQGSSRINPLTYNTTQDEAFSKIFTLDSPNITDAEYNGYAVRGFALEYNIATGDER